MPAESNQKPEKLISADEVLELCRTDVEAMHNLQYLVVHLVDPENR